jgi:hypothetical protein
MRAAEDLLLYPLLTGAEPRCAQCATRLVLVSFCGEPGKPDFSNFRCNNCGRSETFADDRE